MNVKLSVIGLCVTACLLITSCSPKMAPADINTSTSGNNQPTSQEAPKDIINTTGDNKLSTDSKQQLQSTRQEGESGSSPLIEVAK